MIGYYLNEDENGLNLIKSKKRILIIFFKRRHDRQDAKTHQYKFKEDLHDRLGMRNTLSTLEK
jgi:hypothetical protein